MLKNKLLSPYMGLPREIYFIALARTVNAMGALIFPFMALLLTKKIGMSTGEAGLYVTLGGLMFFPSSIIGGKMSDIFGRKKILILFDGFAMIFYIFAIFLEPSMPMVFLLLSASFCFGVAGPSHDAMIADLTRPEQRQGAYSLGYLGFNLGFAFAQIIGGLLFENHFRIMFIIDAVTAGMAILLIGFFVKETLHRNDAIIEEKNITMEKSTEVSVFKVLLARPILIYFALISFGLRFIYSSWSFLMPLHAEANFPDEGASLFGLLGSTNAVVVLIMTPILTSLFKKASNIRRIVFAGILLSLGFGILGFVSTQVAFFVSVVVFTLGEIMEAISSMPFVMNHTPASHRGRISAILPIIMGAKYTVGPLAYGYIVDVISYERAWQIVLGVGLLFTGLMYLLEIYDRKTKAEQSMDIKTKVLVREDV